MKLCKERDPRRNSVGGVRSETELGKDRKKRKEEVEMIGFGDPMRSIRDPPESGREVRNVSGRRSELWTDEDRRRGRRGSDRCSRKGSLPIRRDLLK